MVASFNDAIEELNAAASAFYSLDGAAIQSLTLATTIRAKLKMLFEMIDTMRRAGLRIEAGDELRRFRQAISGGEFESRTRLAMPADGPLMVNISATGQQLNAVIRLAYYESFVAKRPKAKVSTAVE